MRFKRGAKSGLREHMEETTFRDVNPGDVAGLVAQMGKRQLAERMAGTTDRSSRAYKNARDNISRWMRGARTPRAAATTQRLEKAARAGKLDELRQRSSLRVSARADVTVSKRKWSNGQMEAFLEGGALATYLDALENGDHAGALGVVMDEYGLDPDMVASIDAIHGFEMS